MEDKASGLLSTDEVLLPQLQEKQKNLQELQSLNEHGKKYLELGLRARLIAYPRLILDFIFPLIAGIVAAFYLIRGY